MIKYLHPKAGLDLDGSEEFQLLNEDTDLVEDYPAGWLLTADRGQILRMGFEPYDASNIPEVRRTGTFSEYFNLFTPTEQSKIDAIATPGSLLSVWFKSITNTVVDLNDAEVIAQIEFFATEGAITAARKQVVLGHNFNA